MIIIGVDTRIHTRASTLLFDVPIVFEYCALNGHGNLATMTRCLSTARLVISMEHMTNPPELLKMASILKRITGLLDTFTGGRRGALFFPLTLVFFSPNSRRSSRQRSLRLVSPFVRYNTKPHILCDRNRGVLCIHILAKPATTHNE